MIATIWKMRKLWLTAASIVLLIAGFFWIDRTARERRQETLRPPAAAQTAASAPAESKFPKELPDASSFQKVAEKNGLTLKADPATGHFTLEDKNSGKVWTSYPDPDQWSKETVMGAWRNNLKSPLMYETSDLTKKGSQLNSANIIDDVGEVTDFKTTSEGFQLTFQIPSKGLSVPIKVKLGDGFVETLIVSNEIKEEAKQSLIKLRLYPFFGSAQSVGQDGYLLIPDGAGSLIRFIENRPKTNSVYTEKVYGRDFPFAYTSNQGTGRMRINHPVFGIKSGDRSILAIIHEGEEYAEIVAAPSEVYSKYNFASAQMKFRESFFQPTSSVRQENKPPQGFVTYNKERFGQNRVTRYMLLSDEKSDYVGMAGSYRQYLMKEKGLKPVEVKSKNVPFYLDFMGGDREKGFVTDRYVPATTTGDAKQIVDELKSRGVGNMSITWRGWQNGGFSRAGGLFPVEEQLGGNAGMKDFINHAHKSGFPVYFHAYYSWNNTGGDGFNPRNHAMVDMGGGVLKFPSRDTGDEESFVSPRFMEKVIIENDLPKYKELGADGIAFDSIGQFLNSDFNPNYTLNRTEAMELHQNILQKTRETLGAVRADDSHAYSLAFVDTIVDMAIDYSYDIITDDVVPFAPLALHGLVAYTARPANDFVQYKEELLRSIEFGAYPNFLFTKVDAKTIKQTYWSSFYWNMSFGDWSETAVAEYKRFDKALGDVQNVQMTGHRIIAPKVKEVTYANGKKIVVNYNSVAYNNGGISVPALDFIVSQEGAQADAKK